MGPRKDEKRDEIDVGVDGNVLCLSDEIMIAFVLVFLAI